ncbi:hypothetical protein LTR78_005151 [Recurvomyces mirabilis]|uniref:Uncharacterized protein n=1 Tax=Recurvomyces mirabilis TaxID=574656 RepID=A0AAE0WN79_9PEZI|nr:hypothetical protein LTR78_005151 [Recurvomyces mirabilis]KAK5157701.1 hypothetical protein LTS14_003623 [Recurvomyces mirabilis]
MSQTASSSQSRYEKHLMRQRGAGPRNITANFGFSFEFPASSIIPQDKSAPIDPPAKRRKTDVEHVAAKQLLPVRPELPKVQSEPVQPVSVPEVPKTSSKTPRRNAVKAPLVSTVDDDSFIAVRKPRRTRATKGDSVAKAQISVSAVEDIADVLDEEILLVKRKTKARRSTKKQANEPTLAAVGGQDKEQTQPKSTKRGQKKVLEEVADSDNVDNDEEDVDFKPAKRKAASKQTKKALVDLASPPPPPAAKDRRCGGKAVIKPNDDKDLYDVLKSATAHQSEPVQQRSPVRRPLVETDANILRPSVSPKKGEKRAAGDDDFVPKPLKRKRQVAAATRGVATKAAPKSSTINTKIETAVNVRGDSREYELLAVVKHEIDDLEDELSFGDKISTSNPRPTASKPSDENDTPLSPPEADDNSPKPRAKAQAQSSNVPTKSSRMKKKQQLTTTNSAQEPLAPKSLPKPIPTAFSRQKYTALPPTQKTAANDDGDDNDDDDIDWLFATAPRERKRPAARDLKKIAAAENSRKIAAATTTTATNGRRKHEFMSDEDDDFDLDDLVARIGSIAPSAKGRKIGK